MTTATRTLVLVEVMAMLINQLAMAMVRNQLATAMVRNLNPRTTTTATRMLVLGEATGHPRQKTIQTAHGSEAKPQATPRDTDTRTMKRCRTQTRRGTS